MVRAQIGKLRGNMAEDQTPPEGTQTHPNMATGAPEQQQAAPALQILTQYIKDLSFENPDKRKGQQQAQQPNIELGIDVGATAHEGGNGVFEVSLSIQGQAKTDDGPLFIIELDYAGLFQLHGFNPEEMEAVLLIECPRLIFPFARRIIGDITSSGGFPPLLVDPIDFRNLYLVQKQRQQQQQAAQTVSGGPATAAVPSQEA